MTIKRWESSITSDEKMLIHIIVCYTLGLILYNKYLFINLPQKLDLITLCRNAIEPFNNQSSERHVRSESLKL